MTEILYAIIDFIYVGKNFIRFLKYGVENL